MKLTWLDALDLPHGFDRSHLNDIIQIFNAEQVHELLHLAPELTL
jgi:hypothetical protein